MESSPPTIPLPKKASLETASICQLKCPLCPTAKGETRERLGSSYLRLEVFRKFLDENAFIKSVEMANYGEIFLNPDLLKILELAHARNVQLTANIGVNLNNARDEILEALVKYEVQSLLVAIDGVTQATYEMYRKNGRLETVLANVRKINAYKDQYKTSRPQLTWQFIAFGHNESEMQSAKKLAEELKMKFLVKWNWDPKYSPVKNRKALRRETPVRTEAQKNYTHQFGFFPFFGEFCSQLWHDPQINWDGRLLGCCVNTWGDYGNVFSQGFNASFFGEKIQYARKMLQGLAPERKDIPCTRCRNYKSMRRNAFWIKPLFHPNAEGENYTFFRHPEPMIKHAVRVIKRTFARGASQLRNL